MEMVTDGDLEGGSRRHRRRLYRETWRVSSREEELLSSSSSSCDMIGDGRWWRWEWVLNVEPVDATMYLYFQVVSARPHVTWSVLSRKGI